MNMNSILKKEGTHYSPFAAFYYSYAYLLFLYRPMHKMKAV